MQHSLRKLIATIMLISLASVANAQEMDPRTSAETTIIFGQSLFDQGSYDIASTIYTRAIMTDPTYADAYLGRGLAYEALEEHQYAAVDYLQWIVSNELESIALESMNSAETLVIEVHEGHVFRIPLDIAAGDTLQVEAVNASEPPVDPILVLMNPEGIPVIGNDDRILGRDFNAEIENYTIPTSGIYTFWVSHAGGGSEGNIELTYHLTPFETDMDSQSPDMMSEEELLSHGVEYFEQGKFEHALVFSDQLIALNPENANAYYQRATTLVQIGNLDSAMGDFDQAILLNPKFVDAYVSRSDAGALLGDGQGALDDLSIALQLDPGNSYALSIRGRLYAAFGEFDRALADLDQAIQLNPNDAIAYGERGNIYSMLGDANHALPDLDRAIELDPTYRDAYYNRANTYAVLLGNMEQSIVDYDQALAIDPTEPSVLLNRAESYWQLEQFEHAYADYSLAVVFDPDHANAYYGRGYAYLIHGNLEYAILDFKHTVELNPNFAIAYATLGDIYSFQENYVEALDWYRTYAEVAGDDALPAIDAVISNLESLVKIQEPLSDDCEDAEVPWEYYATQVPDEGFEILGCQ